MILSLAVWMLAAGGSLPEVDPVAEAIRLRLEAAGHPAVIRIGDELVHASLALPTFYERRGFTPAWSQRGRWAPRADQLVRLIGAVGAEGLRPSDYHLAALRARLERPEPSIERLVEADLLLTDAFLILAAHTVSGRIDPATFDPEWIAVRREVDVSALLERVAGGQDPAQALRGLQPAHAGYARLVDALARYREIAAAGGWPRIGAGPSIKPGMTDPAVAVLRRRLAASGDLADTGVPDLPERYDDVVVAAVVSFQRRHGLDDDGVVGPKTREALQVDAASRVRQIELNLERWRWLPQELGRRHLLVNVPDFRLRVSDAGNEVLTLRVIVGRAMRRTPVFSDMMRYLVFSPSWEVPPTILRQDKLPELRKDPGYAAAQNMRVFQRTDGGWTEVDAAQVDWPRATAANVRLRQRPGPANALGGVKFMFPNRFNVYLHDTPARELFARSQRDFSSGCIRVETPLELAVYLLSEDPAWTRETILAAMQAGQERSVSLPRPIPVHIQYWTAWAAEDGTVQFRRDIYGRDGKLDAALRLPPPDQPEP